MKTKTNGANALPYTTTAREVSFGDATITIKWGTNDEWKDISLNGGPGVAGLKAWFNSNPDYKRKMPIRVTSAEGVHSLYPVLMASTEEAAKALGVAVGEGRTFATVYHAKKEHYALFMAGVQIPAKDMKFGLSPARPIAPTQAELPLKPTQPSLREQFADVPF